MSNLDNPYEMDEVEYEGKVSMDQSSSGILECDDPIRPDVMLVKEVLTSKVFSIIDQGLLHHYFVNLWKVILANINEFIETNRVIIDGKKAQPWDILRFGLKGGTSILKALEYIKNMKEDTEGIAHIFSLLFQKSDWDSLVCINHSLKASGLYYQVYSILLKCIVKVNEEYGNEFNLYFLSKANKFIFDLDKKDIKKIYGKTLEGSNITILGIKATPSPNGKATFTDYERNTNYKNKAFYDPAENAFSEQYLAALISNGSKIKYMDDKTSTNGTPHFDYGLKRIKCEKDIDNNYISVRFTRAIRKNRAEKIPVTYTPNFDLFRIFLTYDVVVSYTENSVQKQCQRTLFSELIDISISNTDREFDGFDKNKVLPVMGVNEDDFKGIVPTEYPIANFDYNINDNIYAINEGVTPKKDRKRCDRIRQMMTIKCQSEQNAKFLAINSPHGGNICDMPYEINEENCKYHFDVDWGDCRGLSKDTIISALSRDLNIDPSILWKIKKEYLCNMGNTYENWVNSYPQIKPLLQRLMKKMFDIMIAEVTMYPKLINPYLNLPNDVFTTTFIKNVLIDTEFMEYMAIVRTKFDTGIIECIRNIDKDTLSIPEYTRPFLIGDMAFQLSYNYYSDKFSEMKVDHTSISKPKIAICYNVVIETTEQKLNDITNKIASLFSLIKLYQQDISSLNLHPRFKIVNLTLLDEKEIREIWSWNYLSLLKVDVIELKRTSSDYTFISIENNPRYITIRLNVIMLDTYRSVYRTGHILDLTLKKLLIIKDSTIVEEPRTQLNIASITDLFNISLPDLKNNKGDRNLKWVLDYTQLKFLCTLNAFVKSADQKTRDNANIQIEDCLTSKQEADCTKLAKLNDEQDAIYQKDVEMIRKFFSKK